MNRIASGLRYDRIGSPLEVLSPVYDIQLSFVQSVNASWNKQVNSINDDFKVHVKWMASSVNPSDINQIEGTYALQPLSFPAIGGNEGVGRVLKVGSMVKNISPGQWVIPSLPGFGTWRTESLCHENDLYVIQDHCNNSPRLTIEQAATIQVNPTTAYRLLSNDIVKLSDGDVVIQNAANSAVGRCVIQIASMRNIKTVNIVRDRENFDELKQELLNLGATIVINEQDVINGNRSSILEQINQKCGSIPKLALNAVGGQNANQMTRLLDKSATMITYGGMSKKPTSIPTSAFIYQDITFKGFWMSNWYYSHHEPKDLERVKMMNDLVKWISSGILKLKSIKSTWWEDGWMDAIKNVYSEHKQVLLFEK